METKKNERLRAKSLHGKLKWKRTTIPKVHPSIPIVTKTDAATPVAPLGSTDSSGTPHVSATTQLESGNFGPLLEDYRTPITDDVDPRPQENPVRQFKTSGGPIIENIHSRTMRVDFEVFEVPSIRRFAHEVPGFNNLFWKTTTGVFIEDWDAPKSVMLPISLVESVSGMLMGRRRDMASYLTAQAFVRNLIKTIDFPDVEHYHHALHYGAYIAWAMYDDERADIIRTISCQTIPHDQASFIVNFSSIFGITIWALLSFVASVRHTMYFFAQYGWLHLIGVSLILTFLCMKVTTHATFVQRPPKRHRTHASVNSIASPPLQHPKSRIVITDLTSDHCKTNPEVMRVTGIALASAKPTVFAKNVHNMVLALEKRAGAVPPSHLAADRSKFIKWAKTRFHKLTNVHVTPHASDEEWYSDVLSWIESANCTGAAKKIYCKVALEMFIAGESDQYIYSPEEMHEMSKRSADVKLETILNDPDKFPRQILAATAKFILLTAPTIRRMTGIVSKRLNNSTHACYAPGLSARKLAQKFLSNRKQHTFNGDFNGFDVCQDYSIGKAEVDMCKSMGAPPAMLQCMLANLKTHGNSRLGVKFNTPYKRNSGDSWTTFFNTIWAILLITYAVNEAAGHDINPYVLAGGDDTVGSYDHPTQLDVSAQLSKLGFPADISHTDHDFEVEFLKHRLLTTTLGPSFVPMPGNTIAKLGYSVRAPTEAHAVGIARGAALSGIKYSSACPPLHSFYEHLLRITENATAVYQPAKRPWTISDSETGEATPETWMQLQQIYGWTPELQAIWERELSNITTPGTTLEYSVADLLVAKDAAFKSSDWNKAHRKLPPLPEESPEEKVFFGAPFHLDTPPHSQALEAEALAHNKEQYCLMGNPKKGGGRRKPKPTNTNNRPPPTKRRGKKRQHKRKAKVLEAKGHGDYSFGERAGAAVGSYVGGAISNGFTSFMNKITGQGDYTVSKNSISQQPVEFAAAAAGYRIAHTDYVCDVLTPGAQFNTQSFTINPLNGSFMPWLPNLAQNFEEYEIMGMVMMYKSTSGDAVSSTNASLGTVIMATQYNVEDPPFPDKLAMEQFQFATSTVPSCSMMHPVECDRQQSPVSVLYVASPDSPSQDPKLSTFGTFTIATVGQQAAANLGELWVAYDIIFRKPRLLNGVAANVNYFGCNFYNSGATYDIQAMMKYVSEPFAGSSFAPTLTSVGALQTITFPPSVTGTFQLYLQHNSNQVSNPSVAISQPSFNGNCTYNNCTSASGNSVPFSFSSYGCGFGTVQPYTAGGILAYFFTLSPPGNVPNSITFTVSVSGWVALAGTLVIVPYTFANSYNPVSAFSTNSNRVNNEIRVLKNQLARLTNLIENRSDFVEVKTQPTSPQVAGGWFSGQRPPPPKGYG
jgi:hypothetical protein